MFGIVRMVGGAILRKVANSLGFEQLKPTLQELVPSNASVAYRLVEIAALLTVQMTFRRINRIDGTLPKKQSTWDSDPTGFGGTASLPISNGLSRQTVARRKN